MRRVFLAVLAVAALVGLLLWRRSQGTASLPAGFFAPPSAPPPPRRRVARSGPTRDELYERAKELDIKGRSKMNKAELERAVAEHGG